MNRRTLLAKCSTATPAMDLKSSQPPATQPMEILGQVRRHRIVQDNMATFFQLLAELPTEILALVLRLRIMQDNMATFLRSDLHPLIIYGELHSQLATGHRQRGRMQQRIE